MEVYHDIRQNQRNHCRAVRCRRDLEADSLDAVEIIMAIEDEFDIEVPDEDAEKFQTVSDIVNYVEAKA